MPGFNHSNYGKNRGTLNPMQNERVHIQYKNGMTVPATPSVAQTAIQRGEAKLVTPPNGELKKK